MHTPPELILRFFRWFCDPDSVEDIEGDLYETFQRDVARSGVRKAKLLFACHVLKLLRPAVVRPLRKNKFYLNNFSMLRNYISTAWRNMKREKVFAFMNIAGLAIGIGCGLVIYKIISYEMSFDAYHHNYKDTYRLITRYQHPQYGTGFGEGQVHPLAEALRNDFAGVDAAMTFYSGEGQITVTDNKGEPDRFYEYSGVAYAEPSFFKIFDFDFIAGDASKALINRGSAVITSSLAQKYFKLKPSDVSQAMGKSLIVNTTPFVVTGVISDTPKNSDLPFTFIGDYQDQTATNPYFKNGVDWDEYNSSTNCWVMLPQGASGQSFEEQLAPFMAKYTGKERATYARYVMQPLSQLHFDSRVPNYNKRTVSYSLLTILGIIGAFLVVSACINFINMSTAQAVKRAKEIGVRKSLGVRKLQLVKQFLAETVFISFIASVIGLGIAQMLFTLLDGILGYRLQVQIFTNITELFFLIGLVMTVGVLSGFYPAIVMAGMNPINALKNNVTARSASGLLSLRRSLVVVQFVISQVLIIGTIVAGQQMNYLLGNNVGFDKEAVIVTKLPGSSLEKLQSVKTVMQSQPGVEAVTMDVGSPMSDFRVGNVIEHPRVSREDRIGGNLKTADEDYISLFHLKLIAGRNLPVEKDTKDAVINRTLAKTLGYDNPADALGDSFKYSDDLEFKIIGVVEDFHSSTFYEPIENVILSNLPWNIKEMAIKINTGSGNFSDVQATINNIKTQWDKLYPDFIFDYAFLDQKIARMYENEKKTSQLFRIFSTIAIFIGCLGLYGLVSYMANQKTKEIGIRKVLGASVSNIIGIFSKEMIILVVAAFLVAAPLAWYVMRNWLQGFKYQVDFSPFFFAAALLISITIALLTIGYKAIVASSANPVDALRSE